MTLQEILFIVSIVFFVLAVVFIGLAVAIFFVRNVPDVRADLSGKKRANAVAEIAAQRPGRDRRKGVARVEPTSGNLTDSGSLAEPSPLDNHLNQVPHVNSVVADPEPAAPKPQFAPASASGAPAPQSAAAEPESDDSATSVLADDDAATTVLPDDDSATSILADDSASTTILPDAAAADAAPPADVPPAQGAESVAAAGQVGQTAPYGEFEIVRKIVLRESEQVIKAS